MIDFDEFVVIRGKFLENLNKATDRVMEQKKAWNMDFSMLEKVLEVFLKNRIKLDNNKPQIVLMKKQEVLKHTLDFFKSIDDAFYRKAIQIILQQNKNIKFNIYNLHNIKNFNQLNDSGIQEYTRDANIYYEEGKAIIHIPTRKSLKSKEEKLLDKDMCTLDDLYAVVHEISHLFDLDLEKTSFSREEITEKKIKDKRTFTREMLCEATTIAFEGMLTQYLLKNTQISPDAIFQIVNTRIEDSYEAAQMTYVQLLLAKEKSLNGEITNDFVEKIMRDFRLTVQETRHIAISIINSPENIFYVNRYAIGGLIAPTIVKTYQEKGVESINTYLEQVQKDNLNGALETIGIDISQEGINTLISNMRKQYLDLNKGER